ncbi:MAG: hypothetical protein NTY53_08755 [Kiritimatiellaeota bacterium]|nr:hypothetical protein [Kiritimatiellota bacterium]
MSETKRETPALASLLDRPGDASKQEAPRCKPPRDPIPKVYLWVVGLFAALLVGLVSYVVTKKEPPHPPAKNIPMHVIEGKKVWIPYEEARAIRNEPSKDPDATK